MAAKRKYDLAGQRFGRWTVGQSPRRAYWPCKCDCGAERLVRANGLTSGRSQSCGCLHREAVSRHGWYGTPTHKSWESMLQRCTNSNSPDYQNYGGRGISVHPEWLIFESFFSDMGERPAGLTLDRINTDGPYEKQNCRWATRRRQQRNRRITEMLTIDGITKPLNDWAEEAGHTAKNLRWRLAKGWSFERALGSPKALRRKLKQT